MSRIGRGVLVLVAALVLLAPVVRAAGGTSELLILDIRHGAVQVFDQFRFPAPVAGTRPLPLVAGFSALRVLGSGGLPSVQGETLRIPGRLTQATLTYRLPLTSPFFFDRMVLEPTTRALLFAHRGLLPSGPGAPPFRYVGQVELVGHRMTEFQATDLPAGTQILWPMSVGNPTAWAGAVFVGVLAALVLIALVLNWRRYRALSAMSGAKASEAPRSAAR